MNSFIPINILFIQNIIFMIFYIIFIFIWIAIVTLAKNKIKQKIKSILYKDDNEDQHSTIYKNIEQESFNLQNTLNLNVVSIRDELQKIKKKPKKKRAIKEDILEEPEIEEDELDIFLIFQKTREILSKLISAIIKKIKEKLNI